MTLAKLSAGPDRNALIGVGLMMLVSAFSAVDSVLVRLLAGSVHPFVMAFTRGLFGLVVFLPWILRRPAILRSHFRVRHVVRAALKVGALVSFFVAFSQAKLADVTAIAFTSPIFVTIGAWAFLGETPRALRLVAVAIGFAGCLMVLRPGQVSGIPPGLLFALLGAFLTAVIQLILKPMSGVDATDTLVAWNLIITVPIAAIPAVVYWANPEPWQWALLGLQGALGALSMFAATRAFSLAEASLIAPFDFLRLPFVAVLGWVIFAQDVPLTTWVGGGVIFSASLMMARSARRRKVAEI
jgi:drug/metabolite transporter (DMT)-like permease